VLKRLGLLSAALILVLAACGDDGASLNAAEQEFADALAADLIADPDNPMTSDADASCVAEAIVAEYGTDRLGDLGIAPGALPDMGEFGPSMSDAEQNAFVDIYFDCVDIKEAMAAGMSEGSEGVFGQAEAECVMDTFDDDTLRQGLLSELDGTDWEPPAEQYVAGFKECVDLPAMIKESMLAQGLPEAAAQCIADGLDDTMVDSLFASMIGEEDAGDPGEMPAFMELVMTCMG
jgi:hypothetical protein